MGLRRTARKGQPDSLPTVTISIALGAPTLVDRIFSRTLAVDAVLVAAGAALTAFAAQVTIPWIPVPFTLQTFAVLLVGASIGPIRGALSMLLYLGIGIAGLPVFAEQGSGWIVGMASGGYLLGFAAAAALVGWLAQLRWDRRFWTMVLAFAAGSVVIYAFGVPWLYATFFAGDLPGALEAGLWPFLLGDLLKAVAAGIVLPLAWKGVAKLEKKSS